MNIDDFITDPKTGFFSADKLYRKLKKDGISYSKLKNHLKKYEFYELTKQTTKSRKFNTIYSDDVLKQFQIDIIVYDCYEYHKYKYILCVIDVHSRFAVAIPLTNRRTITILESLKEVFKQIGKPESINCDLEFNTKEINKYAEENNITIHFSEPYDLIKNSIVERFNRTICNLMNKYRTYSGNYNWSSYLPELVNNYNNTYHKTIKATPYDVFHGKDTNKQTINRAPHDFTIGDKVRIKRKKKIFDKGDLHTYSKDVFVVDDVKGNKIYLRDINRSYKPYDLMKTTNIIIQNKPDIIIDRKSKKLLKKLDLNLDNIVEGKRKKKKIEKLNL